MNKTLHIQQNLRRYNINISLDQVTKPLGNSTDENHYLLRKKCLVNILIRQREKKYCLMADYVTLVRETGPDLRIESCL